MKQIKIEIPMTAAQRAAEELHEDEYVKYQNAFYRLLYRIVKISWLPGCLIISLIDMYRFLSRKGLLRSMPKNIFDKWWETRPTILSQEKKTKLKWFMEGMAWRCRAYPSKPGYIYWIDTASESTNPIYKIGKTTKEGLIRMNQIRSPFHKKYLLACVKVPNIDVCEAECKRFLSDIPGMSNDHEYFTGLVADNYAIPFADALMEFLLDPGHGMIDAFNGSIKEWRRIGDVEYESEVLREKEEYIHEIIAQAKQIEQTGDFGSPKHSMHEKTLGQLRLVWSQQ